MANGGARPGAGRKPKADLYHADIRRAERKIRDHLAAVVEAEITLALGVWSEQEGAEGKVRVYQRPPDRQACEYLMNRILGKPVERQEVDRTVGTVVQIVPFE